MHQHTASLPSSQLTWSHPLSWWVVVPGYSCAACGADVLRPQTQQQQLPGPLRIAAPTPGPQKASCQPLPTAWTPCCPTRREPRLRHAPTGLMTPLHQTMLGRPCMPQAHVSPGTLLNPFIVPPWQVLWSDGLLQRQVCTQSWAGQANCLACPIAAVSCCKEEGDTTSLSVVHSVGLGS